MESLLSHGNVCTGKGLYKFNIFYYFIKCFYELLCKAFILEYFWQEAIEDPQQSVLNNKGIYNLT